jgi:hypothetical protein
MPCRFGGAAGPRHSRRIGVFPRQREQGPILMSSCRECTERAGIAVVKTSARKSSPPKTVRRKPARRKSTRRVSSRTKGRHRWSARVTRESDALDLAQGVFTRQNPQAIAASLKRSAERSHRRKSDPYRSALSMLTFYINRAGKKLPPARRKTLQRAKVELRKQFGRE